MNVYNSNQVVSIRVETARVNVCDKGGHGQILQSYAQRAFITHESSARAELCDVEPVYIGLEVHN